MNPSVDALQQRLGHRFASSALLTRALTHRSAGAEHNERLEFLGDAVLQTAISAMLYERFAGSDEGDLTRVRAHLVREDSLARVALAIGLPDVLRLSEGEARGGETYELGGPEVMNFRELIELTLEQIGRKRLLVPLPWALARIQAFFMELMPKPMLTRDQVLRVLSARMEIDAPVDPGSRPTAVTRA